MMRDENAGKRNGARGSRTARNGARARPARLPPAEMPRLRESNKADKRRRIRDAAFALFSKHGYDETTMRQIARHAGVALGTLALYAGDKRDLVLLIFNERIPQVLASARARATKETALVEKLVAYFRVLNEDFHRNLKFARIHLQLNYYSGGMHSAEYYANRQAVFDFVEQSVREAQSAGAIATDEDASFIAKHFFFVYSAALRWWIASERPDLQAGVNELRRLFRLQVQGLLPSAAGTGNRK